MPLPLSFRFEPEFVAQIDAARGDVSRTMFVRRAIQRYIAVQAPIDRGADFEAAVHTRMQANIEREILEGSPAKLGKGVFAPVPKRSR